MYNITNYTYKKAKKLGVKVKPSTNKTKKQMFIKNGAMVGQQINCYGNNFSLFNVIF